MVNVKHSAVFPISVGGGGGVYRTLVNEATTLTDSGHYYSNSLASDININAGSLTSGKQILWFNDSANNVVFNGLTSIGGVSIPANKGVKIEPNNYIEFTIDSTGVITKNRGTHTIAWEAGYTPPFLTFTYASPGDTNGIIYYLGATKYNASFVNPVTRGELTTSASNSIDAGRTPDKAFDRLNNHAVTIYHSNGNSQQWIEFLLTNGKTMKITSFELLSSSSEPFQNGYSISHPSYLQGWNGSSWDTIHSFSATAPSNSRWYSGSFTNETFYSRHRIYSPTAPFLIIGDIELYGDLFL